MTDIDPAIRYVHLQKMIDAFNCTILAFKQISLRYVQNTDSNDHEDIIDEWSSYLKPHLSTPNGVYAASLAFYNHYHRCGYLDMEWEYNGKLVAIFAEGGPPVPEAHMAIVLKVVNKAAEGTISGLLYEEYRSLWPMFIGSVNRDNNPKLAVKTFESTLVTKANQTMIESLSCIYLHDLKQNDRALVATRAIANMALTPWIFRRDDFNCSAFYRLAKMSGMSNVLTALGMEAFLPIIPEAELSDVIKMTRIFNAHVKKMLSSQRTYGDAYSMLRSLVYGYYDILMSNLKQAGYEDNELVNEIVGLSSFIAFESPGKVDRLLIDRYSKLHHAKIKDFFPSPWDTGVARLQIEDIVLMFHININDFTKMMSDIQDRFENEHRKTQNQSVLIVHETLLFLISDLIRTKQERLISAASERINLLQESENEAF